MWNFKDYIQPTERLLYDSSPSWWNYKKYTFFSWILFVPLIVGALRKYSTRYGLTDQRILESRGIMSADIKSSTYRHVTSVHVKQTFWGRLFDYGDLIIDSMGTGNDVEFIWKHVKDPLHVKNIIESYVYSNPTDPKIAPRNPGMQHKLNIQEQNRRIPRRAVQRQVPQRPQQRTNQAVRRQ